jgi:hypothetical protein
MRCAAVLVHWSRVGRYGRIALNFHFGRASSNLNGMSFYPELRFFQSHKTNDKMTFRETTTTAYQILTYSPCVIVFPYRIVSFYAADVASEVQKVLLNSVVINHSLMYVIFWCSFFHELLCKCCNSKLIGRPFSFYICSLIITMSAAS